MTYRSIGAIGPSVEDKKKNLGSSRHRAPLPRAVPPPPLSARGPPARPTATPMGRPRATSAGDAPEEPPHARRHTPPPVVRPGTGTRSTAPPAAAAPGPRPDPIRTDPLRVCAAVAPSPGAMAADGTPSAANTTPRRDGRWLWESPWSPTETTAVVDRVQPGSRPAGRPCASERCAREASFLFVSCFPSVPVKAAVLPVVASYNPICRAVAATEGFRGPAPAPAPPESSCPRCCRTGGRGCRGGSRRCGPRRAPRRRGGRGGRCRRARGGAGSRRPSP